MASISVLPSGAFRAQVRVKGHPPYRKTFPTEPEAVAWAVRLEAQLKQKSAQTVLDATHTEITFAEACTLYFESPAYLRKAKSTQGREAQTSGVLLRHLSRYALSNLDAPTLQSEYFDKRVKERTYKGTVPAGDTLRLEKALLSSIFKFALRRGLCRNNPIVGVSYEMPRPRQREIRISADEEVRLYGAAMELAQHHRANRCLYPWLTFIFNTGTRPGEAAKIQRDWCDWERREIRIPRLSHKTRRPRVILLSEGVSRVLEHHVSQSPRDCPYLFYSHTEKHGYRPYAYAQAWRRICAKIGLSPDVVPHGSRHEYISRLFENTTLSDTQIATLVGDVHPLSLQPYKHLRINALRDEHDEHIKMLARLREDADNQLRKPKARVVKLVDTSHLKCAADERTGSSPVPGTTEIEEDSDAD